MNVRLRSICILFALIVAAASTQTAYSQVTQPPPGAASTQGAPQAPAQTPQPSVPAQAPPAAPVRNTLAVVVLDPAHGGADPGAHGASGIVESDVVLSFARLLRISLEGQGLRVMLTRQANEDPSFDDRSKIANAQRGDIFISLHVSSTGQPGTVRVYSLPQDAMIQPGVVSPRSGMVPWDLAQLNFVNQSRRLAELIQIQMAQRFQARRKRP